MLSRRDTRIAFERNYAYEKKNRIKVDVIFNEMLLLDSNRINKNTVRINILNFGNTLTKLETKLTF